MTSRKNVKTRHVNRSWQVESCQHHGCDVLRLHRRVAGIHGGARSCRKQALVKVGLNASGDDFGGSGDELYDKRFGEYVVKLKKAAFVKIYDADLAKLEQEN